MTLAFVIYKYFPYGGLQRDFLRVARLCYDRGYKVDAYCLKWSGEKPDWLNIVEVPVKAYSKIEQYKKFQSCLEQRIKQQSYPVVVGFNKMPGLDVYFSGDPCFEHKATHLRGWWYKFTGRYKHFSAYEKAIFTPGAKTHILQIAKTQKALFERYYGTEPERVTVMPPGINKDRCAGPDAPQVRQAFREEFELAGDELLLLQIGSGFRTKGLDRTLRGLASLPHSLKSKTRLFVIGEDDPKEFKALARRLNIGSQVVFFSGRDDVPRFLLGADLLLHPAYAEAAGTVILEAIVSGLPVLATDVCGYAEHVQIANAGKVLSAPFSQTAFNAALLEMLLADRSPWQRNGLVYADTADIYSLHTVVADIIERVLKEKQRASGGLL